MLVRKLTKDERVIVHKLATEFDLKHESIGNWRRMILFIYKDQLTLSIQRNSQVISSSLNSIAESSQLSNQNVADVIAAGPSVPEPLASLQGKKKARKTAKTNSADYKRSNSAHNIYFNCNRRHDSSFDIS